MQFNPELHMAELYITLLYIYLKYILNKTRSYTIVFNK